jgi:hypothetical protein
VLDTKDEEFELDVYGNVLNDHINDKIYRK